MIGGQYLDVTGRHEDEAALLRLKTGRLFEASVGCALWVAGLPESEQAPWRAFAAEVGLLFQLVDDLLDGDGVVLAHGREAARRRADEAAARAEAHLDGLEADTGVLAGLVATLATRTA
jgi:geranylgeranyl diphosphate synthase type II